MIGMYYTRIGVELIIEPGEEHAAAVRLSFISGGVTVWDFAGESFTGTAGSTFEFPTTVTYSET